VNISEDVSSQIRRRRAAAHRCEPLDAGYRDPLDAPTDLDSTGTNVPLPARRRSSYKAAGIVVDGRIILVRAFGARDALESGGLKPIFSGRRRSWVLDATKLADTVAILENAGYRVSVRGDAV
jgi:hypothetical protein